MNSTDWVYKVAHRGLFLDEVQQLWSHMRSGTAAQVDPAWLALFFMVRGTVKLCSFRRRNWANWFGPCTGSQLACPHGSGPARSTCIVQPPCDRYRINGRSMAILCGASPTSSRLGRDTANTCSASSLSTYELPRGEIRLPSSGEYW